MSSTLYRIHNNRAQPCTEYIITELNPVQNIYTTELNPIQNTYITELNPVQNTYITELNPVQNTYMTNTLISSNRVEPCTEYIYNKYADIIKQS